MVTKLDKAKVIITALHNLEALVTDDNKQLMKAVNKTARSKMEVLDTLYWLSVQILEDKIRQKGYNKSTPDYLRNTGKT